MIISLSETHRVKVDSFNHTLQEFSPSTLIEQGFNKGEMSKEKWVEVGFYPNMEQVIRAAIKEEVAANKETFTFEEYLGKLESTNKRIVDYIKENQ